MSSLNASLASALSGLIADQGALAATTNNVANVNTAGYSRQEPVLSESDPVSIDSLSFGTGVTLQSIESITDPILESQVQQQTQSQGQFTALASALQEKAIEVRLYALVTGIKLRFWLLLRADILNAAPVLAPLRTAGEIDGLQTYSALKVAAAAAFVQLPPDELDSLTRNL